MWKTRLRLLAYVFRRGDNIEVVRFLKKIYVKGTRKEENRKIGSCQHKSDTE